MTAMPLTPEQIAIVDSMAKPGLVLCGQIMREAYNGDNLGTAGRLVLHIGAVPEDALPGMRQAILEARDPKPKRKRKTKA